jgi:hypothetical protein
MTRASGAFKREPRAPCLTVRRRCRFSGSHGGDPETGSVVGDSCRGTAFCFAERHHHRFNLEPCMRRSLLLALAAVAFVASFTACREASPPVAAGPDSARETSPPDPHGGAPALLRSRDGAAAPAVEPIAPPPGGTAIADIWARRAELDGREVTVRGQVVKANNQIMGRNWVHLRDGSGSEADGTHDLTITTDAQVAAGDTVTVTGVLAVGKDFGAGYVYEAILENGRIVR